MAGEPTLQELIREALDSRLLDVHTALPGKVRSYDRATHTAEVEPMIQRATPRADGSTLDEKIPPIQNVPVAWPRGRGFYLEFGLEDGDEADEGILLFSEAAMGMFRETGQLSKPGDLRRHSLSYAAFLPFQLSSYDDGDVAGGDEGVIIVPSEAHMSVRTKGEADDFVVLVEKLVAALSAAIPTVFTPNDGGAAAFATFKTNIEALTVDDIGSNKLKAGKST